MQRPTRGVEAEDAAAEREAAEAEAQDDGLAAAVLGGGIGAVGDGGDATLAMAGCCGGGGVGNGTIEAMMTLGVAIGDASGGRIALLKQQEAQLLAMRHSVQREARNQERSGSA